jgi:hypothetical protein
MEQLNICLIESFCLDDIQEIEYIEEEIKRENQQDTLTLLKSTEQIKEISQTLHEQINLSGEVLQEIDTLIEQSEETLIDTNIDLNEAKKFQSNTMILKVTAVSTGIGLLVGGPLGAFAGAQIGLVIGGAIVGSVAFASLFGGASYGIMKQKTK